MTDALRWRSRAGRRRILVLALAAVLGVAVIWLLLGRDDSGPSWGDYAPKWSPDGKRIVFESTRNDPKGHLYSIYVMNADGSGLRELAGTDAELPSWSPDGKHIVYVQGQLNYDQYDEAVYGGGGRIMVMQADGSGKRELAFSGSTDAVRWSPDGRWIAYEAHSHDPALNSRPAVYIIHPDGSGLRLIARDAFSPSWSPDSKLLAFSGGDGSLFSDHRTTMVRVSSGKKLDLAWGPSGQSDSIAWSPDGSKIAFIAGEVPVTAPAPNASVYVAVANADGNFVATSPPENLEAVTEIHGLAWLPGSGDRVIYYSPKGAFLSSINGGHDRLLNEDACCAAEPSPDGKKVLYVEFSDRGIVVAPINGGSERRLTQTGETPAPG